MKDDKILIIEDATFMRGVLRNILEDEGYTNILEAGDGDQGVVKFVTEHPKLVFLDLLMPEVDGFDVLEKIGSTAHVIVVTKVNDEGSVERATALGAKGFITKPFKKEQIVNEANRVLTGNA